jgi:hypothetical protein
MFLVPVQPIGERIGRHLARQGLLVRNMHPRSVLTIVVTLAGYP